MAKHRKFTYSREVKGMADEYGYALEQEESPFRYRSKPREVLPHDSHDFQTVKYNDRRGKTIVMRNQTVYDIKLSGGRTRTVWFSEHDHSIWSLVKVGKGVWLVNNEVTGEVILDEV